MDVAAIFMGSAVLVLIIIGSINMKSQHLGLTRHRQKSAATFISPLFAC